ncbi:TPA: hypothetical protein ACGJ68_006802 [Pseudomonas aeruginosa]|jgi:DNA-binding XRE family transcriptional regulator|uniref:hypothetical protein n=1 Tax=Pseudomonadota TaxID=1224 RepID=UPI00059F2CE4|nr:MULTISPECIES: hypothetical protein [Pseudomonadota]EIU5018191.1 hypothetical protein [Pseudomonas aeruginosa]EKM7588833.1 hypothetical protein [Pseudomonas aeruginosa]EKX8556377.1 hypothetical protein [Pseudomonas aeruginosa]ELF2668334.1 hypothetical protein [Pseudomonas aeruginosa]EMB0054644.1 hypothetical protein [Pseudomonas aeruginosa]
MTGQEFELAIKAAGYNQARFAKVMGVHRQTIGSLCQSGEVARYWAYALAGLVASKSARTVASIVEEFDLIDAE